MESVEVLQAYARFPLFAGAAKRRLRRPDRRATRAVSAHPIIFPVAYGNSISVFLNGAAEAVSNDPRLGVKETR